MCLNSLTVSAYHSHPISVAVLIVSLWNVNCIVKNIFHQYE